MGIWVPFMGKNSPHFAIDSGFKGRKNKLFYTVKFISRWAETVGERPALYLHEFPPLHLFVGWDEQSPLKIMFFIWMDALCGIFT